MEMRDCSKCGKSTPFPAGFYKSYRQCRECVKDRVRKTQQEREKTDPEYLAKRRLQGRMAHFKKQYGLSPEQYQDLMKVGACVICGSTTDLRVDHCHASGAIRGVLCHGCNTGLGSFRDDPAILRRAAEYLETAASGCLAAPTTPPLASTS